MTVDFSSIGAQWELIARSKFLIALLSEPKSWQKRTSLSRREAGLHACGDTTGFDFEEKRNTQDNTNSLPWTCFQAPGKPWIDWIDLGRRDLTLSDVGLWTLEDYVIGLSCVPFVSLQIKQILQIHARTPVLSAPNGITLVSPHSRTPCQSTESNRMTIWIAKSDFRSQFKLLIGLLNRVTGFQSVWLLDIWERKCTLAQNREGK